MCGMSPQLTLSIEIYSPLCLTGNASLTDPLIYDHSGIKTQIYDHIESSLYEGKSLLFDQKEGNL